MTLQQLKYFSTMAEVLHYTDASKQLYISQSSLSYAIAELEKELGAPLFEKRGKKTELTKYGKVFLPYAQHSLAQIDEGVNRINRMLGSNSIINLGYVYSVSFDCLPRIIKGFCSQPGNSEVSFNFFQGLSSVILQKLKRGELDLAISISPGDESVSSLPIYDQDLYLVVPLGHPLAEKELVEPDDLREENFVSITPDSSLRHHLDGIFRQLGFSPKITFEAEECNAMASFVSAQFGVAVMPEIPALRSYRVVVRKINSPLFTRKIHLLWNEDSFFAPATAHFRDYLRAGSLL